MYCLRSLSAKLLSAAVLTFVVALLMSGQKTRQKAKFELEPLLKGLDSSDPPTLRDSAFRLSLLTPAARILLPAEASTVLQRLTSALAIERSPDVRQAAAYGLGSITPYLRGRISNKERDAALFALGEAVEANNPDSLRQSAAWATSNLSKVTGARMPNELRTRFLDDLTDLLQSSNPGVQGAAAEAIGSVFRNADGTIAGAYRGQIEAAVDALLKAVITGKDPSAQAFAVHALGSIHHRSQKTIAALSSVLSSDSNAEVRIACASTLGDLASDEQISAPALASALLDTNEALQVAAASSLAFLGAKAARLDHVVENLGVTLQQDDSPELQQTSAWALGRMGAQAASEANDLMGALQSGSPSVRRNAAWALGQVISFGNEGSSNNNSEKLLTRAEDACRRLTERFNDPDSTVRSEAAGALALLANQAERNNSFKLIHLLEEARNAMASQDAGGNLDPNSEQARKTIDENLKVLKGRSFRLKFLLWANDKWIVLFSLSVLSYLLWFAILRFILLLRRPLLILHWNDILQSSQALKIPRTEITIPLRYGLLLGFYNFHGRVLDAWVDSHCSAARENFKNSEPCKERSVWFSLPVALQDEIFPELTPALLASVLNRKSWHIRILGEGGVGKTALACQIAIWGMHDQTEQRLSRELMLPVVLGPNTKPAVRKDLIAFVDAIRRELQIMIGSTEPVSKDLADKLLRKKRILVVLDGVSEMPHDVGTSGQDWEIMDHPDFPVNALVITSRVYEPIAGGLNVDIAPMRIDRNHLIPFISAYLEKGGKRLDDITLYESCRRLAAIVGIDRGVTPLLARLYAQQIMTVPPLTGQGVPHFPRNVPELILAYLNVLNQKPHPEGPDNPTLHLLAKVAAWECLRYDLRPGRARKSNLIAALEKEGFGKAEMQILENSLGLIKTIAPEEKEIYFVLDSVADYLGAMRAAELCQSDDEWRELMARCTAASNSTEAVRGFVTALAEYCELKQTALKIPTFVLEEMNALRLASEDTRENAGLARAAAPW